MLDSPDSQSERVVGTMAGPKHKHSISTQPSSCTSTHTNKSKKRETYSIQPATTQNSLRGRLYTPPIPLQIPHDIPAAQLREHARHSVDLRGREAVPLLADPRRRGCGRGGGGCAGGRGEEVSVQQVPEDGDDGERGQRERFGFVGGHFGQVLLFQ